MQPENVTFPSGTKLVNRAPKNLVSLAQKLGVGLGQFYARIVKREFVKIQRYAHACQFNRAKRACAKIYDYLGCVFRYITRKIDGCPGLNALARAKRTTSA